MLFCNENCYILIRISLIIIFLYRSNWFEWTLVQVMAWSRASETHDMNQWWPKSPMPYGITRFKRQILDQTLFKMAHDIYGALFSLQWRHNDHDGVSNRQPHGCLLDRIFRRRSKKTSKLRVTGPLCGEFTGTGEFPPQRASYAENVSIWWRRHESMAWISNHIHIRLWDVITHPCLASTAVL